MHKITGGYVLQPRCFDKSETSNFPPVTRELWSYLLRNVNYKADKKHMRGCGFFSLSYIQESLCWYVGYRKMTYSKPQLTKSLRRLREANMIETTKATRGINITVCNYGYYQDPKNYEGNGERTTKEQRSESDGHTITKKVKKEELKDIAYSEEFEKFWKEYPKKKGKFKGFIHWQKHNCDNGLFEIIMTALREQKNDPQWLRDDGKYIPQGDTWINNRRWEDETKIGGSEWE